MNIEIANQQQTLEIDEDLLRRAIRQIADEAGYAEGEVSLAILTDAELHRLNRQHLDHDYATDVLSFVFERESPHLEGEILVSADMAATIARELDWPAAHELVLYVVHGMLHLVGYDDKEPSARELMRVAERRALARLEIAPPPRQSIES